jgi:hypothetical protein
MDPKSRLCPPNKSKHLNKKVDEELFNSFDSKLSMPEYTKQSEAQERAQSVKVFKRSNTSLDRRFQSNLNKKE